MTTHVFESADVEKFARLSGDFNPLHCDPVAARRRLGGQQVIHGVLGTLWALNDALPDIGRCRFETVKAVFARPIPLGVEFESSVESSGDTHTVKLSIAGVPRFEISFEVVDEPATNSAAVLSTAVRSTAASPTAPNIHLDCVEQTFDAAANCSGELPLYLDPVVFEQAFPRLAVALPVHQLAVLLATTRLVGMQCPGLHSVFRGLQLEFRDTPVSPSPIAYRVKKADSRFSRIALRLESDWMSGTLDTFHQPPQMQPSFSELKERVVPSEFSSHRALVIGGSRGIGEVAAKLLAAGGAETRITHHLGANDATSLYEEIDRGGGSCESLHLDVAGGADAMCRELDAGLGDWVPNLCVYTASPRIDMEVRPAFSRELLDRYTLFYVDAFEQLVKYLLTRTSGPLQIVYPSTVALDVPTQWSEEYAAAKAAGERLCNRLQELEPRLRIVVPRFPRLETDQTATVYPTHAPDIGLVVLDCLRDAVRDRESG